MLNAVRQDLRYALRMLLARPAFTCAAVLTLALGVGANSAIFSVIDAVLLRPLAYPMPQQLVSFRLNQSPPDLADVASANRTFANLGGEAVGRVAWTGGETPEQLSIGQVTGGFFATLGVGAERGRTIAATDEGSPFVIVLSHALWQERFGADSAVVGRSMPLAGQLYTVIGVMPAGFESLIGGAQAWTPLRASYPDAYTGNWRDVHILRAVARLRAGVPIEQAGAEMALIDRQLASRYPAENRNRHTELVPLKERVVGAARGALLVLFAAVCLVLLIACANFGNLLLARACERGSEVAVRRALGAGRARLVRQLLVESALIALAGGALGALLAWFGTRALVALRPDGLPRLGEIGVDLRVFAFTFAVALLTGVVFGLFPAWAAARAATGAGSARAASGGRAQQGMRSAFVVVQLAIALVLLVGAGLLVRTFWNLRSVDPGFQAAQLLTFRVELPEKRYRTVAEQTRFRSAALEALDALPGARAAQVSELPLSGESLDHNFLVEGWPPVAPGDEPSVETRSVLGDYFAVMGIPLRGGRDFAAADFAADAPRVGIANDALVRKYFRGEDPVGKRVRWAREDTVNWITIVGVAGDVHQFGLDQPDLPTLYSPYPQAEPWKRWTTFVVRTRGEPLALAPAAKQAIWALDSQLPITKLSTMRVVAAESVAERRFDMLLLALFAALAVTLAAIGVYGVVAYAVAQRTREIGVRVAIGARLRDVVRLVLRGGLRLALLGIGIGLAGAFALTRLMRGMLYGVAPADPATLGAVACALLAIALLACWLPARRAARVDPMEALRHE